MEEKTRKETMVILKRRRAGYRPTFTRIDNICQDQAARRLENLDGTVIQTNLNKLEFELECNEVTQSCIANLLLEEEQQEEELDSESHLEKVAMTLAALKQLYSAERAERLASNIKDILTKLGSWVYLLK